MTRIWNQVLDIMRLSYPGIALLAALLLLEPAVGATQQDESDCAGGKLEACTRIINDAAASPDKRAIAFRHRAPLNGLHLNYIDRVIADYTEAIRLSSDSSVAARSHYDRGHAFERKGDFARAVDDYRSALELESSHTAAREALDRLVDCKSAELGVRIAACTRIIESSQRQLKPPSGAGLIAENIARAYLNRGSAYLERANLTWSKQDEERGHQDLEQVFLVKPDELLSTDQQVFESACPEGLYKLGDTLDIGRGAGAFKQLLTAGDAEQLALERKMLHGNYERTDLATPSILHSAAQRLVRRVQDNLEKIDPRGRTVALLYADHFPVLCTWVVTRSYFSVHRSIVRTRFTGLVRDGLGVTSRAAPRAPVRRDEDTAAQTDQHADRLHTVQTTAVLESTARAMLPPAIRSEIAAGEFDRLVILADEDLGTLPFAALPVIKDRPLVDFVSIIMLPDVGALLSPQPRKPSSLRGTKLVVGDPDFSLEKVWKMRQLPGAKAEAKEIAQRFGSSALIERGATRGAVIARLNAPDIDLAYFATHGIADGINPMDGSFLALSGEHLLGRDIQKLKLKSSPLVVMSACQTGLGKVFRGGVFGLARAWFFAGAPQVVGSLWNVDDNATKTLMIKFMNKVADQIPLERAMQEAMRETSGEFTDPALWASFVIYGQPTQF